MPLQNLIPWPEHLWPLSDVKNWILSSTPNGTSVEGPNRIYNEKLWGVTSEFQSGHESVIFKGCKLSLFSNRTTTEALLSRCCPDYVPELLAWNALPNGATWTLHRSCSGLDVEGTGKFENILEMVRTLAKIQINIARLPAADITLLPQTSIEQIPKLLDYMIQRIADSYLDAWLVDDGALLNEFALPTNVMEQLEYFRPKVAQWAEELSAGDWPVSIDHLDFNISNAMVQDNGQILIFDWEETVMSCPFFSIDRLLYDADNFEDDPESIPQTEGQLLLTHNQMAVRNAYIDALPWYSREKRERAFDLAMCLASIKTAYECEPFNQAVGRENGLPEHAARCFGRALHFWQAMASEKAG